MGRASKIKRMRREKEKTDRKLAGTTGQFQNTSLLSSDPAVLTEEHFNEFYSSLSEEQRKIYFRKILKENVKLKEDLNENKLSKTTNSQLLMPVVFPESVVSTRCKGIEELSEIEGETGSEGNNEFTCLTLYPEREHKANSRAQMHFRLAESQFFRLEDDNKNYRVTKVEYFVNPILMKRFQEAQQKLKATRGEEYSHPVLAFHGTSEDSISSIVKTGFLTPGDANFKQANDSGWYGRGIYLSEYPSYAREYMERGGVLSKLLLCEVLIGKVYHCQDRIDGEEQKQGFDSHLSPEMHQLILFNPCHILPSYVVHFEKSDGDFRYRIPSSL